MKYKVKDDYKNHQDHEVQWESNEGGLYRMFCATCGILLDIFTYVPRTLLRFIFREGEG